jgi:hypothetical protein
MLSLPGIGRISGTTMLFFVLFSLFLPLAGAPRRISPIMFGHSDFRLRVSICCSTRYCGQPFKQQENDLHAWRSSSGKLYCSEFCADDEEEATFQNMRCAI